MCSISSVTFNKSLCIGDTIRELQKELSDDFYINVASIGVDILSFAD
jgi:hypothetical protein